MANPAISRISAPTICNIVTRDEYHVIVNASECGVEDPLRRSGPGHDDRDHREAMVLSEGHIQCGLTVIPFSAAAADAVGITGLNAQGDIFPDTGFQSGLQVQ